MQKYVLLVDSEANALALMETALRYFYDGKIEFCKNAEETVSLLKSREHPELILIDHDILINSETLMNYMKVNDVFVPIVTTSRKNITRFEAAQQFSMITGVINKPLDAKEFSYTVKSLTTVPHVSPAFVPLSFETILNLPQVSVDLFISLSDTNFVKVSKKEDKFTKEDAEKLQEKGFKEIFIKASSCYELLNSISLNLEQMKPDLPKEEQAMAAMNSIENLENISKFFGWTPEIVENAKRTVQAAIKILSKNDSLMKTLNSKMAERTSHYSHHIGLISFLSCTLGNHFDWIGETGKTKLILAALFHDFSLDPKIYQIIKTDFEKTDIDNKAPEIIKYRMHPFESAKAVKALDTFSTDVEQIVLQHHEKPDGSGFPRALTASRISHLSTFFIIMEELVEFLGDGHYIEMNIEGFCTEGKKKYTQGNFKKVFEVINEELSKKLERV